MAAIMGGVSDFEASRVFLAGDWHGNRGWAQECFDLATAEGCDVLVQLGDFGLWPGREAGWLDHVEGLAERSGIPMLWVDGNHEDHDSLDRWRAESDKRGLVRMRAHVTWATRGARWNWSGRRFGALGGAVSVDRFLRREGVNWWAQEALSQADVDRLGDEPLDVLFAHAAPASGAMGLPPLRLPGDIVRDARRTRDLISQAVARTRPELLVHGHYHQRVSYRVDGSRAEGLAHDGAGSPDAWAVLDLRDGLTLTP